VGDGVSSEIGWKGLKNLPRSGLNEICGVTVSSAPLPPGY